MRLKADEAWQHRRGLGTSVPVLIVSAIATLQRSPEIALGNLVGSIIVNVSLGLSIASLVKPVRVDSRTVRRGGPAQRRVGSGVRLRRPRRHLRDRGAGVGDRPWVRPRDPAQGRPAARRSRRARARNRGVLRASRSRGPAPRRSYGGLTARDGGGGRALVRSATAIAVRFGLAGGSWGSRSWRSGPRRHSSPPGSRLRAAAITTSSWATSWGGNLFIGLLGAVVVGSLGGVSGSGFPAISLAVMVGVSAASWGFMARGKVIPAMGGDAPAAHVRGDASVPVALGKWAAGPCRSGARGGPGRPTGTSRRTEARITRPRGGSPRSWDEHRGPDHAVHVPVIGPRHAYKAQGPHESFRTGPSLARTFGPASGLIRGSPNGVYLPAGGPLGGTTTGGRTCPRCHVVRS